MIKKLRKPSFAVNIYNQSEKCYIINQFGCKYIANMTVFCSVLTNKAASSMIKYDLNMISNLGNII